MLFFLGGEERRRKDCFKEYFSRIIGGQYIDIISYQFNLDQVGTLVVVTLKSLLKVKACISTPFLGSVQTLGPHF